MGNEQIPLKTFDGFLKQIDLDRLSIKEKNIFDALFPLFHMESGNQAVYQQAKDNPLYKAFYPLVQIGPVDERPRRFAGYNFPRNRYYTVTKDAQGTDNQSLAHELRAYRNPIDIGMVEVIDLANGCKLNIKGREIELLPEQCMGILIHPYDDLPSYFTDVVLQYLPGFKSKTSYLFRVPFKVLKKNINRTIDLRYPDVREWFFETFKVPSETTRSKSLPLIDPTIAYSQFHLENETAPTPKSFWNMLPTLINPDLGGGSPSATGSTLFFLGQWMRNANISALIYPSARCDSAVVYNQGRIQHFQGWNLIHYEDAPIFQGPVEVFTHDPSPWAWVNLSKGVDLHVSESGSRFTGSFAIEGMVNYWAKDYLGQIESLETARKIYGHEGDRTLLTPAMALRVWHIGRLLLRWLRMRLENAMISTVDSSVHELQGLAIPYNLYMLTGRITEEWIDLKEGKGDIGKSLLASMRVSGLVEATLKKRHPNSELESLLMTGVDVEWMMLIAGIKMKTKKNAVLENWNYSQMINEVQKRKSCCWLDQGIWYQLQQFVIESMIALAQHSLDISWVIDKGHNLQAKAAAYLQDKSMQTDDS